MTKLFWQALTIAAMLGSFAGSAAAADVDAQKALAEKACPAELNYLVGEWDGENSSDVKFEAPLGSCYLIETLEPHAPGRNYYAALLAYNSTLKNWSYLAASPSGKRFRFENGRAKGNTLMLEEADVPAGTIARFRYIKLSNDQVQELWENSADGGKTWTTRVSQILKRKKAR